MRFILELFLFDLLVMSFTVGGLVCVMLTVGWMFMLGLIVL